MAGWKKTLGTVLGFGALTVVLGHLLFDIPGMGVKSNFAEVGILASLPFLPHGYAAMGVALFTAFNVAPEGALVPETLNHVVGALFAWHFYRATLRIRGRAGYAAVWVLGVGLYYFACLLPVLLLTNLALGLSTLPAGLRMLRDLVASLKFELAATAAIAALFFTSVREFRERLAAEGHLAKLSAALDQNPIAVAILSAGGVVDFANPWFCRTRGMAREEVVGLDVRACPPERNPLPLSPGAWEAFSQGQAWHGELQATRPDGSACWESVSLSPIRDAAGALLYFVVIALDIHETVRLREQLVQSQKMESIGRLAAGIAHDFNNILTSIMGYTELARTRPPGDGRGKDYLDAVHQASLRAKDLVAQILTVTRRRELATEPVRFGDLVREVAKLLRATVPTTIDIQVQVETEAQVLADAGQLHQVLMNLGTNAFHAMEKTGGILALSLQEIAITDQDPTLGMEVPPGTYLLLKVKDTGCGIPAEVILRIFDPYFTTKPLGRGTGLGLSVVRGVIEAMHGAVRVYSEVDRGTVFHLLLPRLTPTGAALPGPPEDRPLGPGTERILFIDDEPGIVELASRGLPAFGYTVEAFADPTLALARLEEAPEAFGAVVTDLTMPHLTGLEVAARLQELRPDLPVLVITGFTDAEERDRAQALGIRAYLEKPLTMSTLHRELRCVLDGS